MRNIGSDPQNWRMTTTLEMAASTIEPSTAALHLPMTSSTTKRIAEMGALNAAARPAAAPMGANMRSRSRERFSRRLTIEATPAPDSQGRSDEFPQNRSKRYVTVVDVKRCLGLVDAAAAGPGKDQLHQHR